jgi:glucose-6-phosphate isomerase
MNKHLVVTNHDTSLSPSVIEEYSSRLDGYVRLLRHRTERTTGAYELPEDSLRLPMDGHVLEEVTHMAERFWTSRLKYVVLVGIGGSNLGTKAVYDAVRGVEDAYTAHTPKLLMLDTISPSTLAAVVGALAVLDDQEEFVINVISKSGTTAESITNIAALFEAITPQFPEVKKRVVVTTDHGSKLWSLAEREGYAVLSIPGPVGGRYSVFSAVGLFPLALLGVDIKAFREGGSVVVKECIKSDAAQNPAMRLALAIFAEAAENVRILNFFAFEPEAESLGKWTRQLVAESLGKEMNVRGEEVRAGVTPIVSIGSTDLHSMAQLYFGGPRDKFTLFVRPHLSKSLHPLTKSGFTDLALGVAGRRPEEIMHAIYSGTLNAYHKHKLPVTELTMPEGLSASGVGAYMALLMLTTMYSAQLWEVNAFDQPNVEDYKQATRKILGMK